MVVKGSRKGFQSIVETHPELLKEWSPKNVVKPEEVSAGSHKKIQWVCLENLGFNAEWSATVASRVRGNGCPYCAGRKPVINKNDLETLYPKLAAEWDDDRPVSMFPIGSSKKVKWKCVKDDRHTWEAVIADRTKQEKGCPYCSGRRHVVGVNDLATTHPKMAAKWDYNLNKDTPRDVSAGSGKKRWWLCDNTESNHSWLAVVGDVCRTDGKSTGCAVCAGLQVFKGFNDLSTTHSHLVGEWSMNNKPSIYTIVAGSHKKIEWICSKGHSWVAVVYSRALYGNGCPDCAAEKFISEAELELVEYIRSLGHNSFKDRKVLKGRELDVYVPEKKIAFEFNGEYYHSNDFLIKHKGVSGLDYHSSKRDEAEHSGVKLYFVWEKDWLERKSEVKNLIRDILDDKECDVSMLTKLESYKDICDVSRKP